MADVHVRFPKPCDERWEAMTPAARHRTCSRCDRIVHDLSQYDVPGIEKLLRDEPGSCVRASIDASGSINTKPGSDGGVRRIVAAIGVSAGLLMSQPVLAQGHRPKGAIAGKVEIWGKTTVIAKDSSGKTYTARTRSNGQYRIGNVPPGVYSMEFLPDCGDAWTVKDVVVEDRKIAVPSAPDDNDGCIVVGLIEIDGTEA